MLDGVLGTVSCQAEPIHPSGDGDSVTGFDSTCRGARNTSEAGAAAKRYCHMAPSRDTSR